ncbi:DUF7410 domain-containing protein [Natrinema salinisoli]|uniref:DUF7410 domain-containing protein n=1 Tax=Natrinema salinisoli TaxID=2878535 RepID=UPI001CEFB8E5|nr:hypothetical protein [Natrinema salinisoli]
MPSIDGAAFDARDDQSSARCPYCDRPFRRDRFESLHRGREHPDRLSDRERAVFERAAREERTELRRFRLYALGTLVALYFGLLITAAFVV